MTHLLLPWGAGRLIGRSGLRPRVWLALFCLGATLPDLLHRGPAMAFHRPWIDWLVGPLHTPAGVLVFCLIFVFLFPQEQRRRYLDPLLAGVGLHFFLDLLQKHLAGGGYYWFFPFSWARGEMGLFWPDESILFIPWLLGFCLLVEVFNWRRRRPG